MRINIVDTPGHADFGGEVERILDMVDGVLLLVDAAEGPMPQTKFVTAKALRLGLKPIVVVNKVDKPDARPDFVHEEVFDLFVALGATESSSTSRSSSPRPSRAGRPRVRRDGDGHGAALRCRGRQGPGPRRARGRALPHAGHDLGERSLPGPGPDRPDLLRHCPSEHDRQGPVARRQDGRAGPHHQGLGFRGLGREGIERAEAGDIVALAGFGTATVADTLCDPAVAEGLPAQPIDPPTLAMIFSINDSPLAGRSGSKVTSRMIRDRLFAEAEGNVAIRISETDSKDAFEVAGRGELQLGVLIETMRREGFELSISRPRVLTRPTPRPARPSSPTRTW